MSLGVYIKCRRLSYLYKILTEIVLEFVNERTIGEYTMSKSKISVMESCMYYTIYYIYNSQLIYWLFYLYMVVLRFSKTIEYTHIHQQIRVTFLPNLLVVFL